MPTPDDLIGARIVSFASDGESRSPSYGLPGAPVGSFVVAKDGRAWMLTEAENHCCGCRPNGYAMAEVLPEDGDDAA